MIRNKNVDPDYSDFARETVSLALNGGASLNDAEHGGWRAPFKGKLESAHVRCSTITDADDSVRVGLKKNGTLMHAAAVDPVAAGTTTEITLTTDTFEEGDLLAAHLTTGVGDALVGSLILVARPYLGSAERAAQSLGQ